MKIDIIVPAAGESVTEADVASWSKKNGDFVQMDEVLLELETDKASMELNAEAPGQLEILVNEGETVKVGDVIGKIDTSVTNKQSEATSKAKPTSQAPSINTSVGTRLDIVVPAAGESVTEGDIAEWKFKSGDFVQMDDILLELETDKASLEVRAEAAGELNIKVENGTVTVGDVIGSIMVVDSPAGAKASVANAKQEESTVSDGHYAKGHPSPAAQKAMSEKGLFSGDIQGSGPQGRILKQDVDRAKSEPKRQVSKPSIPTPATVSQGERVEERQKMTRIRKTIAARMVDAQQSSAMLTTFNEVDMFEVMNIRKKYKEMFKEKYEVGLGFMSFFTKAVCDALQMYPVVNARMENEEIIYQHYCDIGVAVATPKGLVVPVVRDAETMNFKEIESSILAYALKGRDGKLTADEMTGGTFTITNGGTFGSMLSTPILNRPQSAILGMHNIVQRPFVVDGEIKIRPIMYLALTYDHRLIDGAEAVKFLVAVKQRIEDPTRLLIGV